MKILSRYLTIFLCLFIYGNVIQAINMSELRFYQGVNRGLSHSTIMGIAQEADGLLWVATSDGLNCFDGYNFKTYYPDSLDFEIIDVISDSHGCIWAATKDNLIRYNKKSESFSKFPLPGKGGINKLFIDRDTLLIATSKELLKFNPTNESFESSELFKNFSVTAFSSYDDRSYFATYRNGVYMVQNDSTTLIPGTKGYSINDLLPGHDELFIGTEGDGLLHYRFSDGSLTDLKNEVGSVFVRTLAFDKYGNIWVGTFNGLDILDPKGNRMVHYDNSGLEGSLSHSSVLKIFNDNQGGIWLGTFYGGLNYYHPLLNQFVNIRKQTGTEKPLNDNVIGPITEQSNGSLWFGTNDGGINIYNPSDGTFSHITKSDGLGSNDIKAIFLDENSKKAYIGSNNGPLAVVDIETGRVTDKFEDLKHVYDIIPSLHNNNLWIASINGLFLFDPDKKIAVKKNPVRENSSVKVQNSVRVLHRGSDNRLWTGSENGLVVYKENDGNILVDDSAPVLNENINQIFQSKLNNDIWVSTYSGLYRISGTGEIKSKIGYNEGLPGNIVYALLEDANGNLWISTNHGLAYMSPEHGIINTFKETDGIQGNQFNPKSALMASNGRMYFGGTNGITYFNPSTFEKNLYSPSPFISGLRLFNKRILPGDNTNLLKENIGETHRLTFNSDQSSFTLEFGVCNFPAGTHNTFEYILDGLDKQWTTTPEGIRSVTYSNLPTGKYTFRLRSANNDGVMSEDEASLEIVILAPWYKRWWAVTLFAILLLGAVMVSVILMWKRKAKEKQEKSLRKLNEMKLNFFVNMSHELRTPLTLMLLPINELIEKGTDPVTMKKYNLIKNNTLRIRHLIDQLLNYRRAEEGIFKLTVKATDINSLIKEILEPYGAIAKNKKIMFRFDSEIGANSLYVDPIYIEHIVTNLVNNAFKYTPDEGTVIVDLKRNGDFLVLQVKDTGCGIPYDKQKTIFNPFYQINDTADGYGIGLALVKKLVESHHGTINLDSEPGKGSLFTVTIPVVESRYSDNEKGGEPVIVTDKSDEIEALLPEISQDIEISETEGEKTIMVVDDNPEILKYLSEALSPDYKVITAVNGAQAIESLNSDNIDVVISDVMMPDIDGVQLCKVIKRNIRTSHIPVIMLSAKSEISDRLEALNVGADDYIPKPFSMKFLVTKIRNILKTRDSVIRHFTNSKSDIDPVKLTQSPVDEEFLRKAIKLMNENLDNAEFSTDEFAREMCMSRSNLHLKMKALTGESTNDFIRRTRMTKAAELLKTQRYTVAEVSDMVGYRTPAYFATAFKSFHGFSPSSLITSK